jgi:hypothetical protein
MNMLGVDIEAIHLSEFKYRDDMSPRPAVVARRGA